MDQAKNESGGSLFLRSLRNHLIGSVAATLVVGGGLLAFDVGQIRSLALSTGDGPLFLVLLFLGLLSTFGAVALAVAVMTLPKSDGGKADGI
ncbi:hypothetical protein [Rhodospirillum sp. A1_3_36]|uniref:hypothetical protein n=1 Tax=Rhodospirillum sp. A1_3_36 TaxID=3391666 RepID=UPI0039A4AA13